MVGYVEYHDLVAMGIFNCTLYNKLIIKNIVYNPHKGQMKRVKQYRIKVLIKKILIWDVITLNKALHFGHWNNQVEVVLICKVVYFFRLENLTNYREKQNSIVWLLLPKQSWILNAWRHVNNYFPVSAGDESQELEIDDVILHPKYDLSKAYQDIAVIKLKPNKGKLLIFFFWAL